ncbi:MAG TPA: protein-glutamate O-methyltransferase CheR [Edaphobacter sp.]|nr:protein-glutamate O-methyltransferase CheR [Edaphobacter sp.]
MVTEIPELKPRDFAMIRDLAYQKFGLDLRQGKERLVSSRLSKHIRAGGFSSFDEYFRHVSGDSTGEALIAMIDSLTTNHTSFLREQQHFQFLTETVLPAYLDRPKMDIWCAASSTGEEPYSILLSLCNELGARRAPDVRIQASDISTRVLAVARKGVYSAERVAALPPDWLRRFFLRGEGRSQGLYRVKPDLAAKVEFRRVNLMDPFPGSVAYQVIFCRNVMIYFDQKTQEDVVNRLAACLEPGGYLFVGHAESLTGIRHELQYVKPAVYQKPVSGAPIRRRPI